MTTNKPVRVAAAQFSVGSDIDENLQSTLRAINTAAEHRPALLVLPEFVNHLSWYDNEEHCYEVSLEQDGHFLSEVSAAAKVANCYVVVNCTMRRENRTCSGTSLMYSPDGELIGSNDKQVLIGHENNFLQPAAAHGPIIETPFASLGMYACMDGVICETPRYLVLRGAQVLCNSVNSFAPDESSLHIPVRAAENKAFVVAANKIGPLVPADMMDDLAAATNIPKQFLSGAGESQIVDPMGNVLAIASLDQEEVIFADINPDQANTKHRPDGSDLFSMRRPELYKPIAENPEQQVRAAQKPEESISVATIQLPEQSPAMLDIALSLIEDALSKDTTLTVLPELAFFSNPETLDAADASQAREIVDRIVEVCAAHKSAATGTAENYVSLSLPWLNERQELQHCAILLNKDKVQCIQPQLHIAQRHRWAQAGDSINTIDLPFAHIGLLTGEDLIFPETFRLLALQGVDTVLASYCAQEQWEIDTGLFERAGENHINLVAANIGPLQGGSFSAYLHRDFTILTPWESREFDGKLTFPPHEMANTATGVSFGHVTPGNASNKVVSVGTDVLYGRAWQLAQPLIERNQ